jgi:hypothetical protein
MDRIAGWYDVEHRRSATRFVYPLAPSASTDFAAAAKYTLT